MIDGIQQFIQLLIVVWFYNIKINIKYNLKIVAYLRFDISSITKFKKI